MIISKAPVALTLFETSLLGRGSLLNLLLVFFKHVLHQVLGFADQSAQVFTLAHVPSAARPLRLIRFQFQLACYCGLSALRLSFQSCSGRGIHCCLAIWWVGAGPCLALAALDLWQVSRGTQVGTISFSNHITLFLRIARP
jgi:hypothetical protein